VTGVAKSGSEMAANAQKAPYSWEISNPRAQGIIEELRKI
jgi:hypothetical protein